MIYTTAELIYITPSSVYDRLLFPQALTASLFYIFLE